MTANERPRVVTPEPAIDAAFDAVYDLWPAMTRDASTLALPLPGRYVAAGGFFDWLFYWDSYFIVLGLTTQGLWELAAEVVDCLLVELEQVGLVPNFNAPDVVCRGRSQPPLLTSMIREVLPAREREWLEWAAALAAREYETYWTAEPHQTELGLSRYVDPWVAPCPTVPDTPHHRALAESGWDNTPRFGADATRIVPVDLNALLHRYEVDLAAFAEVLDADAAVWRDRARERGAAIDRWLWDGDRYCDLDLDPRAPVAAVPRCLSAFVPLWTGTASAGQARASRSLLALVEQAHGLASCEEGWDDGTEHNHPTGWAYSHWFAVEGLARYGFHEDARRIALKWLRLVAAVHDGSGFFLERYNVVAAGDPVPGRYGTQSGFGWTNGVFVALLARSLFGVDASEPARRPLLPDEWAGAKIVLPAYPGAVEPSAAGPILDAS